MQNQYIILTREKLFSVRGQISKKWREKLSIKIKELPKTERPYEKLEKYGAKKLTNAELLAIIIKSGTKEETSIGLAQKILKLNEYEEREDLNFLREITIEEFMKIKGIGKVKAIQLKAVCELATRMNENTKYNPTKIKESRDVANLLMDEMRFEKQEILKLLMLDSKNMLLKIKDVAIGSSNFASATIKSILNEAVKIEAPKIILVHNHPSGNPTPSIKDIEFTQQIKQGAKILGIELVDHVIIGRLNYKSIFSYELKNN